MRAFRVISREADVNVLFTGWSTTVLATPSRIWSLGHQSIASEGDWRASDGSTGDPTSVGKSLEDCSAFGDHNGLLGLLLTYPDAALYTPTQLNSSSPVKEERNDLTSLTTASSPTLSHIALAGNDRIALTFRQAPNGRLCHVVEFETPGKFMSWYRDPSGEGTYPDRHHMLPGRPKQLLANTATFLLLMEGGEVYSWGDPRQQSLGRGITGEGAVPAAEPGVIEALGGLNIVKVASGGWLSAALSQDGALYLWGAMTPGSERSIRCLREAGAGEVALVEILGEDSKPLDVLDVAVGDNHVVALTSNHRVWVVGANKNGQLGLNTDTEFLEDWTECEALRDVQRVVCGPKTTFAFASAQQTGQAG